MAHLIERNLQLRFIFAKQFEKVSNRGRGEEGRGGRKRRRERYLFYAN